MNIDQTDNICLEESIEVSQSLHLDRNGAIGSVGEASDEDPFEEDSVNGGQTTSGASV